MKTIVVPIDYSKHSRNALGYALEIASLTGARLVLFHAFYPIMPPPASLDTTDVIAALEEGKARSLEDFGRTTLTELGKENGRLDVYKTIVIKAGARMGGSYEMILEAIKRYEADLVIMGMQGGGAISQALLGSNTISVMQECEVPILAVPENIPFRPFRKVVFATNMRKMPPTTDLEPLRSFLLPFEPELKVLHLYRNSMQLATFDPSAVQEQVEQKLQGLALDFTYDVRDNVAEGIQRFIQEQQADLLVLIPQRHSFLDRLLDKSITGKITAHPQVPLLALPSVTLKNAQNSSESMAEA